MKPMTRREFLRCSLTGTVLATCGAAGVGARAAIRGSVELAPSESRAACAYFMGRNLSSISVIGSTYVDGFRSTTEAVADVRLAFTCIPSLHGDDLVSALRSKVGEDFRWSRLVSVEGWMLAETEARLCGLVALKWCA